MPGSSDHGLAKTSPQTLQSPSSPRRGSFVKPVSKQLVNSRSDTISIVLWGNPIRHRLETISSIAHGNSHLHHKRASFAASCSDLGCRSWKTQLEPGCTVRVANVQAAPWAWVLVPREAVLRQLSGTCAATTQAQQIKIKAPCPKQLQAHHAVPHNLTKQSTNAGITVDLRGELSASRSNRPWQALASPCHSLHHQWQGARPLSRPSAPAHAERPRPCWRWAAGFQACLAERASDAPCLLPAAPALGAAPAHGQDKSAHRHAGQRAGTGDP